LWELVEEDAFLMVMSVRSLHDHSLISGSELVPTCDITANEGRQDGHITGLKATLQSLCDICGM